MGTLQQGKWAVLRRHFVLIVLTFCTFWYFDFRSGDLVASVFLWTQSPNLPRTYLPMTNNCFLPYPIVSPFLSCQILTCLTKSPSPCVLSPWFPYVLHFSTFWWWEKGFSELDHILYFENVPVPASYIFLSVNETCTVLH